MLLNKTTLVISVPTDDYESRPVTFVEFIHEYTSHVELVEAIQEATLDWSNKVGGDFPKDFNWGDWVDHHAEIVVPKVSVINVIDVSSTAYAICADAVLIHANED